MNCNGGSPETPIRNHYIRRGVVYPMYWRMERFITNNATFKAAW